MSRSRVHPLLEVASLLLLVSCADGRGAPPVDMPSSAGTRPVFEDIAGTVSLEFQHFNGMTGKRYFPEIVGSGAAWVDFDGDGDLDLYVAQGTLLDSDRNLDAAIFPPPGGLPPRDRLFRLDRTSDNLGMRFVDVTAQALPRFFDYGIGVAAGDADNDGWPDLYITNLRANRLLRNTGDGTFLAAADAGGAADGRWSVSAAFADINADGWLDLYVGNYVRFSVSRNKPCTSSIGELDYCGPSAYTPESDSLFLNRGDGTFLDASAASGLPDLRGPALGVVTGYFDEDHRIDLYVANDETPNHLWLNRGGGRFFDAAAFSGTALNDQGQAESSMGVAAADTDGDGREDLFLSHLEAQTNTLYRNRGDGLFEETTRASGLGEPSWPLTGFGTDFLDFDNDGSLDLFVVNGAVTRIETLARAGSPYPLGQPNSLFRNRGDGTFADWTDHAGSSFGKSLVSRGAPVADIDDDGDPDVVVINNSGPAELLENQLGQDSAWIGFALRGTVGRRHMLGTQVRLTTDSDDRLAIVRTDGNYASARDPRVRFGLGDRLAQSVEVQWLDGIRTRVLGLRGERYYSIFHPESR